MESITEETYSIEQLDAIAKSIEVVQIDVDLICMNGYLEGNILKILPTKTDYGIRMDYFGKLLDGTDFRASSWGCKTTLKPSELIGAKVLRFINKNGKKITIQKPN